MHEAAIFLAKGRAFRAAAQMLEMGDPVVEMHLLIQAGRMLTRAERLLGQFDPVLQVFQREGREMQLLLDQAPERPPRREQRESMRRSLDRLIIRTQAHLQRLLPEDLS